MRLPVELRIEIYKLLLVSSACVKNPGRCLKESKDRELAPSTIADIDATILRTCQSVYKDALPILYQSNRFSFTASGELISFAKDFGSFPRSSNHSDLLPSRLELIRSATLEFYFQQGRSEIRANGLEASAVSWRGWRSPYSEGLIFPHLCDLTLDFADWELSPNEKYFPKVMKQYLNNGFKDLDTLVLKGLEYRPDIVGLLESTMLKTGGKITVHFAYSGLRFGSPDGFRTSLLAKYKEHVKHPNNVDLVGFENRFDEDRSNEDRFKERHIQAERFEEDRFRRCLLAQHGEHVKDHYGYGKLYEEVCCEDDRQNLADLLATAALSTASE